MPTTMPVAADPAAIPAEGSSREDLFAQLDAYRARDLSWREGKVWGYGYHAGREAEEVAKQAFLSFMGENALDPTVHPSLLRLENEVVAMAKAHLGGDAESAGSFTSGGTESCMLAIKSARDHFRATRPDITQPEMVLPISAHAAFHKGAEYFGVKAVIVDVNPETYKVDAEAMRAAITPNTILLVASAPGYAHGVIDPIAEIGALAQEHELLFHVDGCIGGFLLPYLRELGEPVPEFDLRVPGVSSVSMDLHKYAYAPKGASVLVYKSRVLRGRQLFTCARWTGYTVINGTMQSTRSGGPLAGAWAVMRFLGQEGYRELARQVRDATRALAEGIEAVDGLYLLARPEMSLISFASRELCVFRLADAMKARGWYVQPQLAVGDIPANLHLTVSPQNTAWVEPFLSDLREAAAEVHGAAPAEVPPALLAQLAQLDPSALDPAAFAQLLGAIGLDGVELPKEMLGVNTLLNALPPAGREALLRSFVNQLLV